MSYNSKDYARIRTEYEEKYRKAQSAADVKRLCLYEKMPALREIDEKLRKNSMNALFAIVSGQNGESAVAESRKISEELQKERAALLTANGYPADYTDVKYECPLCGDTGFVDTKMCVCMKKALAEAAYESSGIADLLRAETFDTFSLDPYLADPRRYEYMKATLVALKNFCDTFTGSSEHNFLFVGGTGLGKTHLSSAVAGRMIERGFDVCYNTSSRLFADFEEKRFGDGTEGAWGDTARYYEADLLIIDDLGTELVNSFSVNVLYDLVNDRLLRRRPTVISTNLGTDDLKKKYSDRIVSRLIGNYHVVLFSGTDMRLKKK